MIGNLKEIPAGPHLIAPFRPQRSGVDYLNLRQVNLDLMAVSFPGTNNVTRYVRPYSVICWVYWIFPRLLKQRADKKAYPEELRLFREKVESLHLWGHLLERVSGLPGTNSRIPRPSKGEVDLTFDAWSQRSATNTSIQAGVQYGPSLLDLGGLGLLHKPDPDFYQVTEAGERLAEALDRELHKSSAYSKLIDMGHLRATEDEARDLFLHWRIDETSPEEQACFRAALWSPASVNHKSDVGRRSASIELILKTIGASARPLSEQEVRERMAFPGTLAESDDQWDEGMRRQSRVWTLLQFRQLQRLALESLMGWVEGLLRDRSSRVPDRIVEVAVAAVGDYFGLDLNTTVAQLLEAASESFQSMDHYLESRDRDPDWHDLDRLIGELLVVSQEEDPQACPVAVYAMLLMFNCRAWFESDPTISAHLLRGGAARVSFGYWFQTVERMRERPFAELIDWIIKTLVISQHFAVGTNRFDGERIRLRFILEEMGLEPLVRSPWHPVVTQDRLPAMLSLLVSCGTIGETDGGFTSIS